MTLSTRKRTHGTRPVGFHPPSSILHPPSSILHPLLPLALLTHKPLHLSPECSGRLRARLVLPQILAVPQSLGILLVGPVRVTAHPLKRQWLDRLAGDDVQVVVLVPAHIVKQKIALPAGRRVV